MDRRTSGALVSKAPKRSRRGVPAFLTLFFAAGFTAGFVLLLIYSLMSKI